MGDFAGAHANVSFQNVDTATGEVTFYAPVFTDVVYWIAKPVAEAKPVEKSYASPQMINEKPKKEEAKAAAKPVAKPKAVTATAGGAYKVQLGAFKSEAEAEAAWKKISSAHSDVLSGSPTIVKAEVNGGTFYRLRTGSYANAAEAKAACAKLGGQACMPVK